MLKATQKPEGALPTPPLHVFSTHRSQRQKGADPWIRSWIQPINRTNHLLTTSCSAHRTPTRTRTPDNIYIYAAHTPPHTPHSTHGSFSRKVPRPLAKRFARRDLDDYHPTCHGILRPHKQISKDCNRTKGISPFQDPTRRRRRRVQAVAYVHAVYAVMLQTQYINDKKCGDRCNDKKCGDLCNDKKV